MFTIYYHGTCDTSFAPRVELVPAHDTCADYYRLHLSPGTALFLTRDQLARIEGLIHAEIAPVESDESYEASAALQAFRPIAARPVALTAPEFCLDDCAAWTGGPCDCLANPDGRRATELEARL